MTMTRDEAMAEYRLLIGRYGLQWTPRAVPTQEPWDRLQAINEVLDEDDRREALGLRRRRPLTRAVYTLSVLAGGAIFVVIDSKTGISVTNDAERVVAACVGDFRWLPGVSRIIYRDSNDRWDGLAVRDGRFAGFIPIGCHSESNAVLRAAYAAEWTAPKGNQA